MLYRLKSDFGWLFFILLVLGGIVPQWSLAATLHAILVADTIDDRIGRSTLIDLSIMSNLMKSINENTGLSLKVKTIHGSSLTNGRGHDEVTKAVKDLSVGPKDVVIFYYSGHGARLSSDRSRWPSLAVEGRMTRVKRLLPLNWVVKQLKQKNPRFFIAIADSCNSVIDAARFTPRFVGNKNAYQKLFLGHKGYIIASSSKPRQYSYGDPQNGGLFSHVFHAHLNKALASSDPDWKEIMDKATQPIETGSELQPVQNPQAETKVEPIRFDEVDEEDLPDACPPTRNDCAGSLELPTNPCEGRGTCRTGDYFFEDGLECCCENGEPQCFE